MKLVKSIVVSKLILKSTSTTTNQITMETNLVMVMVHVQVGKLQLEEVGVLIKSRMESDVIPQIVGPIPNINVASILDLA